jgi:hypothetical protein
VFSEANVEVKYKIKANEQHLLIAIELPPFLGTSQSFDFSPREWQSSLAVDCKGEVLVWEVARIRRSFPYLKIPVGFTT